MQPSCLLQPGQVVRLRSRSRVLELPLWVTDRGELTAVSEPKGDLRACAFCLRARAWPGLQHLLE